MEIIHGKIMGIRISKHIKSYRIMGIRISKYIKSYRIMGI